MDNLTVSKFNGHDFAVWKFQMMGFLEYHGLLEIVEGVQKRPTSESTEEWDKLDKKARFYIGLSLESTQLRQVMNLKTSAEMWNRLEYLYELKNATSKHLLLQKFFEYKMDDDTSVAQHVAKIEEMAKQLEDLGHKQDEVTLITKVLHSLPPAFRNLIAAWDSVPEEEQTMKNLLPRLMKQELLNKGITGLQLDVDTDYILAKDVKEFVICLFDTGLHLVPKLWFVPNSFKFVLFPSYKTEMRIIKAIQNKEIPQNNDLWEVHQVKRIMESYDDFPKAWNKFKKACFFSDTPSEDTDVKRTKRKEYAKEVDSDVTLCEDSDIPRPPKLKKKCNNFERAQFCLENTLDVIKSDKENVKALSPIPTDPLRIPTNVDKNVDESMSSDNDISNDNVDDNVLLQRTDELLSKIGTIAGDELVDENLFINSDLKEINVNQLIQVLKNLSNQISLLVAEDRKKTKILTEIQEELHQIRKKEIELETNEEFNILNTLPLATEQQILEMERFLLYKRNENQLHQILQEIGGSNPTEMTRKIMNTLFTLELCTKYTLKGKRTNKNNFSTLKVCRVIEKVVIKKGNTTLTEIHKVIENWLIRAKDKLMRKETNASAHSIIVAQEIKDEMDIYECL